jgi:hypothetical protein
MHTGEEYTMLRNNEDERPVIKAEDNSQLGFAFQDSQSQNSNLGMSNIPASIGSGYQGKLVLVQGDPCLR